MTLGQAKECDHDSTVGQGRSNGTGAASSCERKLQGRKELHLHTYNSNTNIAVAVAIDGGLITPVLQDADKVSVMV